MYCLGSALSEGMACVRVRMCNFFKIHARLGVHLPRKAFFFCWLHSFFFFMQKSVLAILIACAITHLLLALDLVEGQRQNFFFFLHLATLKWGWCKHLGWRNAKWKVRYWYRKQKWIPISKSKCNQFSLKAVLFFGREHTVSNQWERRWLFDVTHVSTTSPSSSPSSPTSSPGQTVKTLPQYFSSTANRCRYDFRWKWGR